MSIEELLFQIVFSEFEFASDTCADVHRYPAPVIVKYSIKDPEKADAAF